MAAEPPHGLARRRRTDAGYLVETAGTGPGVLVVHDAWGLLPPVQRRCDQLAAAGFVVFAPDLYQGGPQPDPPEQAPGGQPRGPDPDRARRQLRTTAAFLRAHPRVTPLKVGAVGFELGGWLSLLLATVGDLDAVVTYDAVLGASGRYPIRCPVLGHLAAADGWDWPAQPEQFFADLRAGGTLAQHRVYPATRRPFADPALPTYDAEADALAWSWTVTFLRTHLLG
jgi:carboxymethylenebutenolidase